MKRLILLLFVLFTVNLIFAQQDGKLIDKNPFYQHPGNQRPQDIQAPKDSMYMLVSYYNLSPEGKRQNGTIGQPVWIHKDSLIAKGFFDGSGGGGGNFKTLYIEGDFGQDVTLSQDTVLEYDQIILHVKPLAADDVFVSLPDIPDTDEYKGKSIFIYSDGGEVGATTIVDAAGNSVVNQVDCRYMGRYTFADTLTTERNAPELGIYRTVFEDDYTKECQYVTELREVNDTIDVRPNIGRIAYLSDTDEFLYYDKNKYWKRLDQSAEAYADSVAGAAQNAAQNYADGLAFSAGSFTSIDTTVTSDFAASTANRWNITSFCISGIDNTISLPEPADSIRGNVIEVTHFDTSASRSRATTVQTNFTDFDIYNNLTGDTLNFFNISQDRETAVFTLSEIEGVLRWVYSPKYRTRIIIAVDSIQQIPSLNVNLGDRIKVKSTGAEYLVEPDQLTTPDNLFTVPVNGGFANIQKSNNVFNLSHIGQDTLTQIGKKAFSLFDNILMPSDTIWMDTLTIQNPISISGTSESVLSALNVTGVEGDFIRFNSDNVQLSGFTVTTDTFNLMSRALYFNDIKNVNLTNLNVIGSRGVDTTMLAKGFRSLIWLESCENVLIDNVYTANANTNWGILGKTDGSNISIINSTVRNTYRGGFAFVDGPFNNVLIDNFEADSCNLLFDLDAAVDIYGVTSGTELNKNITIKNGVITNTGQKGCSECWDLRIKTTDGGTVENVKITGGVATDSIMSGMLLIQERIGLGNRNIQLVNNTFEFNGLDYGLRPIRLEDVENITFERNTYTFTDQANLPSTDIISLRSNIGDDGGVIRFIGENFDAGNYAGRFVITDNASPSNDWKSIIFSNNQIVSSGTPIQLTYTDRVLIEANFIQNKSNGNAFLTNFADTVEYYSNIFKTTDAEPAILNGLAFSGIDRSSANLKIRVSDGLTIQGDVINDKLNYNYTFTPFPYTGLDTIPVDTLLSQRFVVTGALDAKTITGIEYTLDNQVTTRSTLVRLLKYTPSTNTYTPFGSASITIGNSFVTNTPSQSISQGDIIYCETTQTGDNITGLTVTLKIE